VCLTHSLSHPPTHTYMHKRSLTCHSQQCRCVFFIQQFTLELLLLSLRETLCATRADAKGGGGAGSASSSNHIILKHLKYLRRLASSSCYYIFLINYALNIPTTARALSRALIFEAAAIIVSQTAHSPPFLRRSSIFLVQIILCARESRQAGGRAGERERCW
jgi:hypothetical protein